MTKRIQLKGPLIPNDYQEMYDFYDMESLILAQSERWRRA